MKAIFISLLIGLTVSTSAQNPTTPDNKITTQQINRLSDEYIVLHQMMKELQTQQAKMESMLQEMQSHSEKMKNFTIRLKSWEKEMDAVIKSRKSELLQASGYMQANQTSFNLHYLQLQKQMQNENRKFTMISNIMKTKHETAKNSISNVR